MSLFDGLQNTEGALDQNGDAAPAVTKAALQNKIDNMTFHNLSKNSSPLVSDLYRLTEPGLYAAAKTKFGNLTLADDLISGMASELFGKVVYFTGDVGGMDKVEVGAYLLHEALHLIGYSEARISGEAKVTINDLKTKCVKPFFTP